MITSRQVVQDLRDLGVASGDILLVHSSYKATGKASGSPEAFLLAVLECLGPEGTLLMPNLNIPGEFTADNPPRWDLKSGRIGHKLGILTQVFKEKFATDFSIHPTHGMMGCGPRAGEILAGHENVHLPCGPGTPWEKYARLGGKTLLIGVNQHNNTTYHCAEEALPDSYRLSKEMIHGSVILDGREIPTPSYLHKWGNEVDFNILNDELEKIGALRRGKIGLADSMLILAGPFLDLAKQKLRQDPRYFLCHREG